MAFALGLFEIGFVCSKLVAVAILGRESPIALATWFGSECTALLLVRVGLGNWRSYFALGDLTTVSLIVHALEYLLVLASPFFILRHPHVFTPCVYTGFVAWTLLGANPLMLTVADYLAEDRVDDVEDLRRTVLAATTALSFVGAACVLATMDERLRPSFYRHETLVMYMRSTLWSEHPKTTLRIKGEVIRGCDFDLVRGYDAMGRHARCYWPIDLVEPFVSDNWCVARRGAIRLCLNPPLPCCARVRSPQVALGRTAAVLVHQKLESANPEGDAQRVRNRAAGA